MAALAVALAACEVQNPQPAVWVPVPDAPIEAVAESLAAYDIVRSAPEFARFARMGRKHEGIEPGLYPLQRGMPMGKVLVVLRRGTPEVTPVTVRERTTIAEVALGLERALGLDAESFATAAEDPELAGRVGSTVPTVEGYLFPTRYYVPLDATALDVVRQMTDTFEARWRPEWSARTRDLGMTRHQIVTLASIIEGEMPHNVDRAFVSSVYHNRLERGMRLQADPTVVYALGERRRLSFDDLRVRSEYNTYLVDGLPPGPIGQPSVASIIAALYPPPTDYLYFVAQADGRHLFSHTYREHLGTIRELRTTRRTVRDAPR